MARQKKPERVAEAQVSTHSSTLDKVARPGKQKTAKSKLAAKNPTDAIPAIATRLNKELTLEEDIDELSSDDLEDYVGLAVASDIDDTDDSDSDAADRLAEQMEDDSDSEDEDGGAQLDLSEDIPLSEIDSEDGEDEGDLIPHQRLTINNRTALLQALKSIALPIHKLPFTEHHSITSAEPVEVPDVDDDLNRELAFYKQSIDAVKQARLKLKAENAPFSRPNDYFAEMVKTDEHMGKVKQKLIDEATSKKASAEAKKQRDLKKFGKQVQVAKQQERDKAKRDTLEKIQILKRSKFHRKSLITNICRTSK
jgi:rRNA-processing protein EBP2